MWLTTAAMAQTPAVLDGQHCQRKRCDDLQIELAPNGTLTTSDGITGFYSLSAGARGVDLTYSVGATTRTIPGQIDDCWEDANSPLSPALDQVSVCLTTGMQSLHHYSLSCTPIGVPPNAVNPLPNEDGHWTAGRLTPDDGSGMWVYEVGYRMLVDAALNCASLDHLVRVFVGDAALPPPADPVVLHEELVSGTGAGVTEVRLDLPAPLLVGTNESLFVSVEMLVDPAGVSCQQTCSGEFLGGLSFWSNAASAPYAWQDLLSFTIPELKVDAYGVTAP